MKLYTEEQVIKLTNALKSIKLMLTAHPDYQHDIEFEDRIIEIDEILEQLTHIELPSDEDVEQYLKSFPYTKHLDDGQYNDGVIVGAELAIQWMRDKIQGGNNEQQ